MLKQFPKTHLVAACGFVALAAAGLMIGPSSGVEAQRVSVTMDLESGTLKPITQLKAASAERTEVTKPVAAFAVTPAPVAAPAEVIAEYTAKPADEVQAEKTGAADPAPAVAQSAKKSPVIDVPPELSWKTFTVKAGDTLSTIFRKAGFNDALMYKVIQGEGKKLARLFKGDEIRFGTTKGELQEIVLVKSRTENLRTRLTDGGFVTEKEVRAPDVELRFAAGTIENSLFIAGKKAGLDSSTTMEMAAIFGWDIDFVYDIRKGDKFDVLYEKQYLDGEEIGNGRVLAANFVNQGRKITAILYTDETGKSAYYTPDGKSVQKAFLRAPIDARISSSFNLQRRHPVLNVVRPHQGTDYAAATGSPIMAAGDGRVRFAGWKGGYGRTIVLQHGDGITTLYAHLSKLGKGIANGKTVKQGQTIGYVGSSGMVTGPHLHYEFRLNGSPRNSRTVKLPDAAPVPKQEVAKFKAYANRLVARLDTQSADTQLALADEE
ncbi:MAG: peptidase M23 [Alteromonadaceae bacterium]|uniref:Peptidase M23 n=2 Tax=Hydrocarboniclastica marina TaxID=2259620 RepID=A0A4P7XDP9_9ALTE|nr:peptidase M23 [Alteromonadaceae bacterium]QCF24936.1 peptidase M23 [Hydrocarboniclastica marina]